MDAGLIDYIYITSGYPLRGDVFACIYKDFSRGFLEHMVSSMIKFLQ